MQTLVRKTCLLLALSLLTVSAARGIPCQISEPSTTQVSSSEVLIDNNHELALRPDGKELWVYMIDTHALVMVNMETEDYQIVGKLKLPGNRSVPISHVIFSPDSRYVYLSDSLQCQYEENCPGLNHGDLNRIHVIDTGSKAIVSTVPMQQPFSPTGSLAITPDGRYLYLTVADFGSQREGIYKLDLQSQQMVGFLEVPGANFITLSPNGRYLYVTRGWDIHGPPPNLFSVIDTATFQILSSVSVGNKPWHVAIRPDSSKAYIANQFSNSVTVVDLSSMQVRATIAVGPEPEGIAITPDGKKAYVGNTGAAATASTYEVGDTVSVIDTEEDLFVKNIRVGLEPHSVVMNPEGTKVYVSDGNANGLQPAEVHVIDTMNDIYQRSIILRKAAFYTPTSIDVTPDGRRLFVISEATGKLLIIDPVSHGIVARQAIFPRAVKVSRNGKYVYVYSPQYPPPNGGGKLLVIDADSLATLKTIDLGIITTSNIGDQRAFRIVMDSDEDVAYLSGGDGDEVIVVGLARSLVMARVWVGPVGNRSIGPARGIAITPDDRKVFVSSCIARKVYVIDSGTYSVVDSISVANCPSEIEISQDGKRIYVQQQHTTVMMTILDVETHAVIRVVDFPASVNGALDFFLPPDERYIYTVCFDPNWVMVYDLNETNQGKVVKAVIKTQLDPFNVAVTADQRFLYLTNFTSDSISVIDTQTNQITDTIILPPPFFQYLPLILRGN